MVHFPSRLSSINMASPHWQCPLSRSRQTISLGSQVSQPCPALWPVYMTIVQWTTFSTHLWLSYPHIDKSAICPVLPLMTEQTLISEQPLGLHSYPPSSSILPISHSDIGISSAQDSTTECPSLHGTQQKKGLWNVANETQRGMQSRHLVMIGMSLKLSHSVVGNVG